MKYECWLSYQTEKCDRNLQLKTKKFIQDLGIEVLSRMEVSPFICCKIDEDDLNFIRLSFPFGKIEVFAGAYKDIHEAKLLNGSYINEPGFNKTPNQIK